MQIVEVDCSQCTGAIVFEVYDLDDDDNPTDERFASYVSHPRAEWHCPFQYGETRRREEDFQELRLAALLV